MLAPHLRKQRQNCQSIKYAHLPSNSLISLSANFCPEGYVSIENDLNGNGEKWEPNDSSRTIQQCAGVQFNRHLKFWVRMNLGKVLTMAPEVYIFRYVKQLQKWEFVGIDFATKTMSTIELHLRCLQQSRQMHWLWVLQGDHMEKWILFMIS